MNIGRRLDLRLAIVVTFALAAIWAATALAGRSDSPSGNTGAGNGSGTVFAQQQPDGGAQPPSGDDCPDRGGSLGNDGAGVGPPDV